MITTFFFQLNRVNGGASRPASIAPTSVAKVGVIGPRTGAALVARGVKADLTARRFVAEGLVEDLLAQPDKMGRVLLLRAKEARDVLPQSLSAAGITVDVVPAYQTRKVQVVDELVLAVKDKVDAVLLTSSSMVDSLVSALGAEYKELLSQVTLVCIGPITAATVREHGLSVNVEASEFTIEGALDAYEQSLAG